MEHAPINFYNPVLLWGGAGAVAISATCFLAISFWLVLLVQKTRVPFTHIFLVFAFCLFSAASARLLELIDPAGQFRIWVIAGNLVAALASALTVFLLYPELKKIVKAIRGLYLSETRRRMLEDYSDELKAVNNLREREAKDFEAIVSSSSDQIYRLSRDGAIEYTSPAVSAFFGIAKAELKGARWQSLGLDDETEQLLADARERALETGHETRGNLSLKGAGGLRHFDFLCSPIFEGEPAKKKVIALTYNFRDVTEKRSFELELVKAYSEMERRVRERTEELSVSRKSFQDLVNTIDGIVWEAEVGKAGFSFVSSQAERITGHALERWTGEDRFWQNILHPEDLARLTGDRYQHPEQKKDVQSEYRIITADNRVLWMRDHIKVIYQKGIPHKMRGIMVDVTAQKKVEAALQTEKEVSQRAAKVKSDFLANMSHEIRTPLNAIIGMSTLALDYKLDEGARECLGTVKTAADSLLLLVNDILDFSKIEAGGVELEVSDFRLDSLLQECVEVIQPLAREKSIRLLCAFKNMQGVRGDPGRLMQVLLNLLGNAVKFTPNGGEVCLHVNARNAHLMRFEVRDNGIGIEQSVVTGLFQPFSQADSSTSRKFGGTGLGLSICKRLVELMGGQIGVESESGKGSNFWFEIPMLKAHIEPVAPEKTTELTIASTSAALRVLVADDNAANRKVVQRMLEKIGLKPELVTNGREAVQAYMNRPFDLIFLDCQMPEMDGYEATRQIRKTENGNRRTPVIALTAHALAGDAEKCREAGMDDYLSKPVSVPQLARAVEKWAAPKESSAVDLAYLHELEQLNSPGKPDLILELIRYFLEIAPAKRALVSDAVKANNLELLQKEAHSFKSTCFNVGARKLAKICAELENLSNVSNALPLLDRLECEVALVKEELQKISTSRMAS